MRILNVEPARYDGELRARLAELGEVDYVECTSQEGFEDVLGSAPYEALLVRLGLAVTADTLRLAPALRFVATPTTGLDHLDLTACAERGVAVLSLKGEEAFLRTVRSTAEHTWALLLTLCRRIPWAHADVLAGHWRREPFLGEELCGKTLGILGLGRLGRMVAGYGLAFGMRVVACDVRDEAFREAPDEVVAASLEVLLASVDVLSVHLPLDETTRGLLSAPRLALLREGATLINTARGEIVEEAALLAALRSGRVAGAALDVLTGDSRWSGRNPESHALFEFARSSTRLLLTPHIGGYGRSSLARTREFLTSTLEKIAGRAERSKANVR